MLFPLIASRERLVSPVLIPLIFAVVRLAVDALEAIDLRCRCGGWRDILDNLGLLLLLAGQAGGHRLCRDHHDGGLLWLLLDNLGIFARQATEIGRAATDKEGQPQDPKDDSGEFLFHSAQALSHILRLCLRKQKFFDDLIDFGIDCEVCIN